MKAVALVKPTKCGRKAFAATFEEAEALVLEGKAVRHHRGLYEMRKVDAEEVEPESSDQETPNIYETKVMTPRKRGRPPKVQSEG